MQIFEKSLKNTMCKEDGFLTPYDLAELRNIVDV